MVLRECFSVSNLQCAWKWIKRNPEAKYKNYFREIYSAYDLAKNDNLSDLSERLLNETYEPKSGQRIYIPKSELLLRPFLILGVEDQIVYQAFANIIAEKHKKAFGNYYLINTFGNVYSGKKNFFLRWQKCYKDFSSRVGGCYQFNGQEYIAKFDLTSCYDTIDHKCIEELLISSSYKLSKDFVSRFIQYLKTYVKNNRFLSGTGIPQGPIASGLISEVILSQLDKVMVGKENVDYFRYVDDIKILGKTEEELRPLILELDYRCRELGLYTNSSKVCINKIRNISDEIKLISLVDEELRDIKKVGKNFEKWLKEITPKNSISDISLFKQLLSQTRPTAEVVVRVIRLLEKYPECTENIISYIKKYVQRKEQFPKSVNKAIEDIVINQHCFSDFSKGKVFLVCFDKSCNNTKAKIKTFLLDCWKKRKYKNQPMIRVAIYEILIKEKCFKINTIKSILKNEPSWWICTKILSVLYENKRVYYEKYLEDLICKNQNQDIAIVVSSKIVDNTSIKIPKPYQKINSLSQNIFKVAGIIKRTTKKSFITDYFEEITGKKIGYINWKKIFGTEHLDMERRTLKIKNASENSMDMFVNYLDSFNDKLLDSLSQKGILGYTYQLGNVGSALNSTAFKQQWPNLQKYTVYIHGRRLSNPLSHHIIKKTKMKTKSIKWSEKKKIVKHLFDALNELKSKNIK